MGGSMIEEIPRRYGGSIDYTGIPEQKVASAVQAANAITVHIKFSRPLMAFYIKFILIRQLEQHPHMGNEIYSIAQA